MVLMSGVPVNVPPVFSNILVSSVFVSEAVPDFGIEYACVYSPV